MARPRFDRLPHQKQAAIIEAASREFASNGFAGASLNQIIKQSGLSKGALYYYFDDKEDLFITVIHSVYDRILELFGELPTAKNAGEFWKLIENLSRKSIAVTVENPTMFGLMSSYITASRRKELKHPLEEYEQPNFVFYEKVIKTGQKLGAVRKDLPDDLIISLIEAIHIAFSAWFATHSQEITESDWNRFEEKFIKVSRRFLEPDPESLEAIL